MVGIRVLIFRATNVIFLFRIKIKYSNVGTPRQHALNESHIRLIV